MGVESFRAPPCPPYSIKTSSMALHSAGRRPPHSQNRQGRRRLGTSLSRRHRGKWVQNDRPPLGSPRDVYTTARVRMKAIDRPFTKIINGTTQFVIPVFQRDYS